MLPPSLQILRQGTAQAWPFATLSELKRPYSAASASTIPSGDFVV